jgi:hypothetical protein
LQELIVATAIVQWRINIVAVTTTRVKGKKEEKRLESDDENNTNIRYRQDIGVVNGLDQGKPAIA